MKNQSLHLDLHKRNKRQAGIILPVALVLLVTISFAGIMAVKNSTVTEQMSNNLRTNVQAQQAAETALRYCELIAIGTKSSNVKQYDASITGKIVTTELTDANATNATWRTLSNWSSSGSNVIKVPDAFYKDENGKRDRIKGANAPRCIIQRLVNQTAKIDGFLITARGFANNARWTTGTGALESGSEVWLQSVLTSGS